MTIEIQALDGVPEDSLKKIMNSFAQDGANIVTAINDTKGTFSVEATFIDPGPQTNLKRSGKMSTFGGPHDMGVGDSEGVALYGPDEIEGAPSGLFLDTQPPGTTGLARRLNPGFNYLAARWDYSITPREFLRNSTVTVSAKGKSVSARPVDWGPNVATGRVADLSPGLAHALGLNTDDDCTLLIPTPADTQIPVFGAAPTVSIDLGILDAAVLPKDMTRSLIVATAYKDSLFWLVDLVGQNEGGQTLMRLGGNGAPTTIRSDTVLLPIKADANVPDIVAGELNKAIKKEPAIISGPPGNTPVPGDDIDAKIFATAKSFIGHITSNVPGTQHGNLACAWAVNEVVRLALGKPISGQGENNGLSTAGLFDVLRAHHTNLGSAANAQPGTIIIAPTVGTQHGHVGIVGAIMGNVDGTKVFSNKSVPGVFSDFYNIGSFTHSYTGKGLEVFFFALRADQFVV